MVRTRLVTLGATTVALIHHQFDSWAEPRPTPMGDWLFAPTPVRESFMTADRAQPQVPSSRSFGRRGEPSSAPAPPRRRHPLGREGQAAQGSGPSRPSGPVHDLAALLPCPSARRPGRRRRTGPGTERQMITRCPTPVRSQRPTRTSSVTARGRTTNVDLACSGDNRNLRPDRSDGAIWTPCWSWT